jgi:hypothetical protein
MVTDLVSAIAALAYGGVRAAYAINNSDDASKLRLGTLADAVVGAGGLVAKNYTGSAVAHEALEALGYAGFANLGLWAGAVQKKVDSVPVWKPETGVGAAASYYVQPTYYEQPVYYEPASAPAGGGVSALEI